MIKVYEGTLKCIGAKMTLILTPSIPRGVQHSPSSIRHPWYLWALRRSPEGDFSVEMQFLVNCNGA